jgi:hypothetical protein
MHFNVMNRPIYHTSIYKHYNSTRHKTYIIYKNEIDILRSKGQLDKPIREADKKYKKK